LKLQKIPPQPIKQNTSVREVLPLDTEDAQIDFEYNNKRELEFLKYKQPLPDRLKGSQEKVFLATVDITKGPIERMVTQIIRTIWQDHSSPKKENRDFIYFYENWYGKDWQGNPLHVTDHQQGSYTSLVRTPVVRQGRIVGYKTKDGPVIHYIPFDKETVDKIIASSIGTDKDTIQFKIRTSTLRHKVESYDEFVNFTFKDLVAKARSPAYNINANPR
jgi:hypothetical protein